MSTVALIISFVLAAQVGATGDRYPVSGSSATADSATSAPASNPPARAPLPKVSPPPGVDPNGTSAPPAGVSNPFKGQQAAPATGTQLITPIREPAVPATDDIPSAYRSSPPPAATSTTVSLKPTPMMKQMLSAPPGAQLSGTPTKLLDVINGVRGRHDQAHRIEAYWDLCSSVADYYLGMREYSELGKLRSMLPQAGPALQQAEAEFQVRLATSKLAAVASQRRLASMMGAGSATLPLPADMPHCGSYETHYDKIFAGRPAVEAQELAALLSSRYSELKDAATAVTRAQGWIGEAAQNDSGQGIETLRALELLALRRRAFVQIARDYNRRIARYTELSTPGDIGAERLVGMLIKVTVPPTAVRPTLPTGTNGRQSRVVLPPPPRTFAGEEGWESVSQSTARQTTRDDAVKPAAAEVQKGPREERSLLVTPR
jgi:hypothetical protein